MPSDPETTTLLRRAADTFDVGSAPVDDLVRRGQRRLRRRRTAGAAGAVVAVVAAAAVVPVHRALQPDPPVAAGGCVSPVPQRVLPSWARGGFSGERPRAAYVEGDRGHLVAIVFGPLSSPPAADRTNKVLWVEAPRTASEGDAAPADPDLRVVATHGDRRVVRTLRDAPGPSTLDLPETGCWHLTLRWSGRTDTLNLRYVRPD